MILQRGLGQERLVEVGLEPGPLAVDDPPLQPLVERQGRELLGLGLLRRLRGDPGEEVQEPAERVVGDAAVGGVLASVVDEVHGHRELLLADPGDRQDLAGVHDRRVEPGLDALVQEHRVQHLAGGRVEAERDVGQAEGRLHVRMGLLEPPDGLERLDAVAAGLLLAGGDRERQAVHEDVARGDPVVVAQVGDEPVGHAHLPVGRARLALLVDRQGHDRGAVLLDERHDPGEPRPGAVTVLVVDRVDHGSAAEHLQAGLQDGGLGRVQHDRKGGGGGQPAGQLAHVTDPVATDVVDAQVEQVGAVADLRPGDLDARLPVLGQHRVAEGPGPVGVGPLPDGQEGGVLPERHRLVERGGGGLRDVLPGPDLAAADALDDGTQVLRGGSAAAADQRQPVVAGEMVVRRGQLGGGQRVVGPVGGEHRQAGVGHRGQPHAGVPREVAQVLAHLRRSGGAVESDDVDAQWLEGRQGCADLRAEQHRAGGLDGHLGDQGDLPARRGHRPAGADQCRLGLQQVLRGLDEDGVDPALQQAGDLLGVRVAQEGEGHVAQRRQLRARPDRAEHPARPVRRRVAVGDLAGDARAGQCQLADPVGDVVLPQVRQVGAEGVGLDAVDADVEVGRVHSRHDVGPGDVEDLVAALEALEVVQ